MLISDAPGRRRDRSRRATHEMCPTRSISTTARNPLDEISSAGARKLPAAPGRPAHRSRRELRRARQPDCGAASMSRTSPTKPSASPPWRRWLRRGGVDPLDAAAHHRDLRAGRSIGLGDTEVDAARASRHEHGRAAKIVTLKRHIARRLLSLRRILRAAGPYRSVPSVAWSIPAISISASSA